MSHLSVTPAEMALLSIMSEYADGITAPEMVVRVPGKGMSDKSIHHFLKQLVDKEMVTRTILRVQPVKPRSRQVYVIFTITPKGLQARQEFAKYVGLHCLHPVQPKEAQPVLLKVA